MLQSLIPTLSQIDPKVLIVLAVVAVVLFIISLVKKAIKAAIFLLIMAFLLGGGVPAINKIKENYGISFDKQTETLELKMAGKDFKLPIQKIKEAKNYSIELDRGSSTTKLSLFYQNPDGTAVSESGSNAVAIPNFMIDTVTKYLTDNGLSYSTVESSVLP